MIMSSKVVTLDDVLRLAQQLAMPEQLRLMALLASSAERSWNDIVHISPAEHDVPLRGLLSDLGPAPSAEDIDEVRHEMWASLTQD